MVGRQVEDSELRRRFSLGLEEKRRVDLLEAGHVQARARCALLLASADQASIDGGSWVKVEWLVSNLRLITRPSAA